MILFLSISSIQAIDSDTIDDVVQDGDPVVLDVNNDNNENSFMNSQGNNNNNNNNEGNCSSS